MSATCGGDAAEADDCRPRRFRSRSRIRRRSMASNPVYLKIAGLHVLAGRFFTEDEETRGAAVCVLGAAARSSLFGSARSSRAIRESQRHWFRVIGVASPQLSSQTEVAGVPTQDLNNIIYVPLNSAILRLEDNYSDVRDEIDGIYLNIRDSADMASVAQVVQGDSGLVAPLGGRFQRDRSRRIARRTEAHRAPVQCRHGRDCLDFPARGRHRHHEHHAGQHPGTHAGDRRAPRRRCAAVGHYPAVRGGGHPDLFCRRDLRHSVRLCDVAPDRVAGRVVDHRHAAFDPARVSGFDFSWIGVWNLSCSQSRSPGPVEAIRWE